MSETIDIETETVPVEQSRNITPILEIGITDDGKNLACKQLSEIQFSGVLVNAMCQLILDFFADALPKDQSEEFKLTVLDLIMQTRDFKQAEKPSLISL